MYFVPSVFVSENFLVNRDIIFTYFVGSKSHKQDNWNLELY